MLIKVAKRIFGAEHVHVDVHGEAEQHGRGGEAGGRRVHEGGGRRGGGVRVLKAQNTPKIKIKKISFCFGFV